jgi:hypothetical protein
LMKKRCCSCGSTFNLSGSGKRQKYCSQCAKRGGGRVWGLSSSNPLNIKGAEKPFEEVWIDRLSGLKDHEGPIALLGPDEQLWRLWPRVEKANTEARHWRIFVKVVANATTLQAKQRHPLHHLRASGSVSALIVRRDSRLGCGWRIVTCPFRGMNVLLHHNGNAASMKRQASRIWRLRTGVCAGNARSCVSSSPIQSHVWLRSSGLHETRQTSRA